LKVIHRHEGKFVQPHQKEYWMGPCRYMVFPEENDNIDMHLGMVVTNEGLDPNKINMHIDFEMPNMWLNPNSRRIVEGREQAFDKLYSINPDIVKSRNEILGEEKWEYTWFPVNEKDIATDFEKEYDIFLACIWSGTRLMNEILRPIVKKYSDRYCGVHAKGDGRNRLSGEVDYYDKLKLNAKSKITLGYNHQSMMSKYIPNARQLESEGICSLYRDDTFGEPHYSHHKSRIIDGFLGKSVVMVFKDGQNIIEDFWEEDKHFLYYTSYNDLDEKVSYVLNNYSEFDNLRNEAFEFTKKNYTTTAWYDKFIRGKY